MYETKAFWAEPFFIDLYYTLKLSFSSFSKRTAFFSPNRQSYGGIMKTTTEKFYKSNRQVQIFPIITSSVAFLLDCQCQCLLWACLSLDCFYWVAAQA